MMVSIDTSKESDKVLTRLYRAMPAVQKVSLVFSAYRMGQKIALAGIKNRFPDATEEQCRTLWAKQHLGQTLYDQVYGNDTQ